MNKKLILKFLKEKCFINKFTKNKQHFFNLLEDYKFFSEIINTKTLNYPNNDIENGIKYLEEAQTWIKSVNTHFKTPKEYKELYKQLFIYMQYLMSIINVESLKSSQNKKLREYQLKEVEYCKEITNFFDKNNLEYFITSGTLLGAIRHKGFIPWDDDIDVGMMRNDYEKLKDVLKKNFINIDKKGLCTNENKNKLVNLALKKNPNKYHYYIGHRYIQIYKGENLKNSSVIDIFPHEYYKDDFSVSDYKKTVSYLKIENNKQIYIKDKIQKVYEEINNNPYITKNSNTIYFAFDSLDSYLFNPEKFMTKDIIFPRKKIKFEDIELYAPNKPEKYIEFQYKNYMELPAQIEIAPDLKEHLKF